MRRAFLFALMMMLICLVRSAGAEITYQLVGQTAGDFSAEGTITTDGTLGVIDTTNLLSSEIWVLSPELPPIPLASEAIEFLGVIASPTSLQFDSFPAVNDPVVYFIASDESQVTAGWGLTSEPVSPPRDIRGIGVDGMAFEEDISLPHTFAVVPEPSGRTLLWFTLALVGWVRQAANPLGPPHN